MMNVAWELKVVVVVVVSDVASLFSQLLCFLWIGKQTFKNEFVIWNQGNKKRGLGVVWGLE